MREAQSKAKAALARLAGMTAPSIAQIETGGQASVETIEALANGLNVSPA
jgi:transcriptional regulator with XRE-family HTH domain